MIEPAVGASTTQYVVEDTERPIQTTGPVAAAVTRGSETALGQEFSTPRGSSRQTGNAPATPVLIVLCGVVGSGKSTFAKAAEHHMPDHFVRCNQDVLGSRRAVQTAARRSLAAGKTAIIDRVNADAQQRATWTELAANFIPSLGHAHGQSGIDVWAIEFVTPIDQCRSRLATRTNHETLHSVEQALHVLQCFSKEYTPPQASEGFSKIIQVSPNDFTTNAPTFLEIDAILQRLATAERHDEACLKGRRPTTVDTNTARRGVYLPWRGQRGRGGPHRGDHYGRGAEKSEGRYDQRPDHGASSTSWRRQPLHGSTLSRNDAVPMKYNHNGQQTWRHDDAM